MILIEKRAQRFIDLIIVLTKKQLTVRYQSSILGYLWSVLNPLGFALVYFIVFNIYLRFNIENYIIVLLSALFPWQWIANTLGEAPHTFVANAAIVKKVAFPRWTIPLVDCLQNLTHFLIAIPVYVLFKLYHSGYPSYNWLYGIPLLALSTGMLLYGASLLLGAVNVFFRDIGHLISVLINILFFATPVIYTISQIPEKYHIYLYYNPFAPIVICWRYLLLNNDINSKWFFISILYGTVFLIVGILFYKKTQYKFAELL